MPILHGMDLSVKLFDVVAFNATGEREMVVSAGTTLSGAVSCARGFNHSGGSLVAVVLPAEANAAVGNPEPPQPLANESDASELEAEDLEDADNDRMVTFSTGELLILSTKSERVSVLVPAAAGFCMVDEPRKFAAQYETDSTKGKAYQVESDRTDSTAGDDDDDNENYRIICLHPDGTYQITDGIWTRAQADEWLSSWHHATSVAHAVRDDEAMELLASNLTEYKAGDDDQDDDGALLGGVLAKRHSFVRSMFRKHLRRMYLASEHVLDSGDVGICASSLKILAEAIDDIRSSDNGIPDDWAFTDGYANEWRNDELEAALGITAQASA